MRSVRLVWFPFLLACVWSGPTRITAAPEPARPKAPMTLADVLAWQNITTTVLSNDGKWLAYRLSPTQGDAEIVVRQTQGDKAYRFGCGESGGDGLAFSGDSRWAVFLVAPTRKESAQLKKQHKPLQNKVALVDLSTGQDTQMAKVRRAAFSGGTGAWAAFQKYAAEPPSGAPPAAPGGPGAPGPPSGSPRAGEHPRPADLILRDLATGAEQNVGNVSDFAFDKTGRWIAWTLEADEQDGNAVVARNLESGVVLVLDSGKASYERPTWTERGDGLAVAKGTEDKAYQDKRYTVVGITGLGSGKPVKTVFDPASDKAVPAEYSISAERSPFWTEDLKALVFGIHKLKKKDDDAGAAKAGTKPGEDKLAAAGDKGDAAKGDEAAEEKPDLVLWHYRDHRLQTQQQVDEDRDRRFSSVCIYHVETRKFVRLADDAVREVEVTPRSRWGIGRDESPYEREASMDGRQAQDVYAVDLATGQRTLAARKVRGAVIASVDASRVLYGEDGHYFVYDIPSAKATNLTVGVPTSFVDERDDHNVVKPLVPPIGWSSDGRAVLLSDGWDVWQVPVPSGLAVNLTANGRTSQVRYQRRFVLDQEEKGIDLSQPVYVSVYGEWTKKGGIARLTPGKPGADTLLWDDASFARLSKAKEAGVFVYSRETFKDPADLYVADADLRSGKKVTSLDAQVGRFEWSSGLMLVEYAPDEKTIKARKLQGALFLPANYQKGKTYPTIVYIYERLSQSYNAFAVPTANGFNKSVYTSNGYAVLMPDIAYKLNDPGRSAVWCVLPALKAAAATGVVDPKRVGLQGHSWGGYQTAFLVTQTDAFAAAVAGAPLTDMVSMYSLVYKNTGGTNQAIFESSQGRFLGGYWDNWEAYYRNSPVFFAKNVKTPLMILHNDKDGAVDFTQGVEYFNTLRRLGKAVWMLEYPGGKPRLEKTGEHAGLHGSDEGVLRSLPDGGARARLAQGGRVAAGHGEPSEGADRVDQDGGEPVAPCRLRTPPRGALSGAGCGVEWQSPPSAAFIAGPPDPERTHRAKTRRPHHRCQWRDWPRPDCPPGRRRPPARHHPGREPAGARFSRSSCTGNSRAPSSTPTSWTGSSRSTKSTSSTTWRPCSPPERSSRR